MAELVTQAEYSRMRGCSRAAVTNAVKDKRITLINGKIDPEVADFQWKRNTDPVQAARTDFGRPSQAASGNSAGGESPAAETSEILLARTRTERARAELFEIEIAEKKGALAKTESIEKAAFDKGRVMRSALEGLSDRLAPVLAAETDPAKIHQLLNTEMKRVLRELAEGENNQTRQ